jgi:hypothetical protein
MSKNFKRNLLKMFLTFILKENTKKLADEEARK